MARRRRIKRKHGPMLAVVAAVVVVILVMAISGRWREFAGELGSLFGRGAGGLKVSATQVDPANDGKRIRVTGELSIRKPPRDPRLGVGANAALLVRHVEMYQWRERCSGDNCIYDTVWSQQPIDSRKFDRPDGHENPPFPFSDAQFAATDIRLGAFRIDPALVAASGRQQALPVNTSTLPPNLAATFRDVRGTLYAGDDPAHPAIGDLRVSFRVVAAGPASLTGIQRGTRLSAR